MIQYNLKNKSGQSVVEYILLSTAVILVVVALMMKNGLFAQAINKTLISPAQMINGQNAKIKFHQTNN